MNDDLDSRNSSPVFVARFSDGEVTRMTTYAPNGKLDRKRGVQLAQHAYRSRVKKEPPAIVEAHFEKEGVILATYEQEALS
jgi:hypothetical protein